ncbi:MAG: FAD-linked oxidase C-terminal domain-containing protein [Anaerolineae bacterium]|nr:FAD-binding protein [Thermoflexales bacterium]MDW8406159.1 FAD-linked oxidase C-terminal domain-containing protein [Anaerolineae bacterium]
MRAANDPLCQALTRHVSGEVRFDDAMRVLYSTDASNYQVWPRGVVLPKTADDVIATIMLCAEHGVPIIPRGGGSGLCGQAIGPGVVIDFSKYMSRILELDADSRRARVQPGLVLQQLNKQLAPLRLQFGPDPASGERAVIGGIIGTNATGAHSIRHGMTADHVISMRCVLADGTLVEFGPRENGPQGQLELAIADLTRRYQAAIRRDFPKVWRRASGYNLDFIAEMLDYDPANPGAALLDANLKRQSLNYRSHLEMISRFNVSPLIVGSEGTLAMVLDATLKLMPKPARTGLMVCAFSSLYDAMDATPAMLTSDPAALELMDGLMVRLARGLPEQARKMSWLSGEPDAVLIVEFDGETEDEVKAGFARLKRVLESEHIPCSTAELIDSHSQADVWAVRKIGLGILLSMRSDHKPISVIEDVAVPVARLGEYVRRMREVFARHKTDGAFYAHASAGVLHVRPLVNLKTIEGLRTMEDIGLSALALCREMGGALSGEHGDGYERTRWNEPLYGQEVYRAFCEVKDVFDPRGLLNPGKKVRGEAMEEFMRMGPWLKFKSFSSVFTYQQDGSFAGLVEQCNGNGICRKVEGGVMCPSYRATLDETHSTRGRANLLRHFITDPTTWNRNGRSAIKQSKPESSIAQSASVGCHADVPLISTEDVKSALSLCLSCKACRSECPSSVDMAKLKSDFLAHYYAEHGRPLRAWLFGHFADLSALAAPFAPLVNRLFALGLTKWMMKRIGVTDQRPFPRFSSQTFRAWWRRHRPTHPSPHSTPKTVALFVDTFANYNHPHVAHQAVELLEAAGYRVIVPDCKCCGRTLVSQGQPGEVIPLARHNIRTLASLAKQGVPILGLEPSCIAMFTDDYLDLLPGEDTQQVAGAFLGVEEFLAREAGNGSFELTMRFPRNPDVLVHGHCHQKAGWGTSQMKRAITLAGYRVQEIDSTCCGMAGAFGYEAEHFEVSRKVGELSVLPAVRAAPSETLIVAPGTSCREQIEHLGGRPPLHPVELLAIR